MLSSTSSTRFPAPVKEVVLQLPRTLAGFKSIQDNKVIMKITAGTDTFLPSDVHISIFLSATEAQPVIVLKESVFIDVKKSKGEANGVRTHWRMLCAGLAFIASESGRPEFAALEYGTSPVVFQRPLTLQLSTRPWRKVRATPFDRQHQAAVLGIRLTRVSGARPRDG